MGKIKKNFNNSIWDMHSHIIYGVDDGSKTVEQSLNMLKIAGGEGIGDIILTPHYNPYRWKFESDKLKCLVKVLEELIEEHSLGIRLHLGSEIFYGEDTEEDLKVGKIPTMAGSRYVLVEFDTNVSYSKLRSSVSLIQQYDRIPILAHVERYECLLKDDSLVSELIEMGAYIQVNASTIVGDNGGQAKRMAKKLLKYREVHFIGTDAHRDNVRSPKMADCVAYIVKKYGEEYGEELFCRNPKYIIKDEYIEE